MSCYLSTSCFRGIKIDEAIKNCGNLSNKFVEISAPHPYETIDNLKKIFQKFINEGYSFTFHNYFPTPVKSFVLNIASDELETQRLCQEMFNSVLELSPYAKNKIYGVHAGYLSKAEADDTGRFHFENKTLGYEKSLKLATSFVNKISKKFEEKEVYFIIENLFPSLTRRSSLFCTFEEIKDFMDLVPKKTGLLLDLGHLNISSNLLKFDKNLFLDNFLSEFGERLIEVHISENNGLKDEHLALTDDSWQLTAIKKIKEVKLKNNIKDRVYCLESRNSNLEDLKKAFT